MKNAILAAALLLFMQAQAPPSTDIFLLDLKVAGTAVSVGHAVNVTARDGYDNQPIFLPDGKSFLYTSIREGRPTDIYRYTIATRSDERSSPLPHPAMSRAHAI